MKKSNVTPKKPKESKYRNSAMWKSIHQLGNQKGLSIDTAIFDKYITLSRSNDFIYEEKEAGQAKSETKT